MNVRFYTPRDRVRLIWRRPSFWIAVVGLLLITALHYVPTSVQDAFPALPVVERILYLVPVATAAFGLGENGGLIVLGLSVIAMLPRAILLSSDRGGALAQVMAVSTVGFVTVWMLSAQEGERRARQQALARLRAINEVATYVTESLDLEQVLNNALDKALEVLDMEAGLIFLTDRQAGELRLVTYRGIAPESAEEVDRLKIGEGFCGRVALYGELMVIPNSSSDPRLTRMAVREEGLRAQAIVPLKSKGVVQGVLAVATRRRRLFPREDLELITALSNHIGVAVENARLHRGVERQLQIQRRLNEVAEEITSELELDRILPKVLRIAEELTGADAGIIALLDPVSEQIHYPYLHNLPDELTRVSVKEGEGLAGQVIESGQSVIVGDYQTCGRAIPQFKAAGLASVAAVPVVSGARPLGMLAVCSVGKPRLFTPQDVQILTAIGRQAGVAIENARLYENLRFYAREITRAQEEERKRIAREAHDETAQTLVALARRLESLTGAGGDPPPDWAARLEGLRSLATQALQSVRRLSRDLRPPVLDDLGLVPAIRGLVTALEQEEGIEARLEVSGPPRRLESEVELTVFRIAQEALNNVRRHAGASSVAVKLAFLPKCIRMRVRDNGKGFQVPGSIAELAGSGKLGLIGMHERARILGGVLRIESQVGQGTEVLLEVPT